MRVGIDQEDRRAVALAATLCSSVSTGPLAFESTRDGSPHIYFANADGSAVNVSRRERDLAVLIAPPIERWQNLRSGSAGESAWAGMAAEGNGLGVALDLGERERSGASLLQCSPEAMAAGISEHVWSHGA